MSRIQETHTNTDTHAQKHMKTALPTGVLAHTPHAQINDKKRSICFL